MNKRYTLEAAEKLRGSDLPLLLAWAPGDKYFPLKYAERLRDEVPNAQLVEIENAKTFVPLDQPAQLADLIADFSSGRLEGVGHDFAIRVRLASAGPSGARTQSAWRGSATRAGEDAAPRSVRRRQTCAGIMDIR